MDTTLYCCSLYKLIRCFVGEHRVEPHSCNPVVKVKLCYINIVCSLLAIVTDFVIFIVKNLDINQAHITQH